MEIIVNGGIKDLDKEDNFSDLDGIMVGREAYSNPYHLIDVDERFYGNVRDKNSRADIINLFEPFANKALENGMPISILLKHLYGMSHGLNGGSLWRRHCAELVKNSKNSNYTYQDFVASFPVA